MARRAILTAIGIAVGVIALQALLIPLFAGPASNIEPRELPIAVAGPAPATAQLTARLEAARPGAFAITTVPDATAADQALRDRKAYAAFILGPNGVALHTASAASPTVAALVTAMAQQLGQPVTVTDVVPTPADDPRGGGFAAGFFPLMITGIVAAVGFFLRVRDNLARILGLLVFAALAGVAGTLVLQGWLGVVGGEFLPVAAVISLIVLAVSASVTGFAAVIGPAGLGLGAALIMLIGNALAGVAAAPELLPQPWGEVGQWLPIGAGATALRSAAWFGGAGADNAIWTLAGWAAAGLALIGVKALTAKDSPQVTA